ncbi:hypothetical protein DZC72_09455 [Maribacter algicola]|uniref:Glucosamine inositolphosphorylceramide transferase 1 N-terminal domain-containing protein n=1 Tax=Maribacter algicola TaxID=2498892 RepID=A0A3R8WDH9_9FLAO|nr:hypothetical protein DZC72_09455 [Maribacter algicola]
MISVDAPIQHWQQRIIKWSVENQSFETVFLSMEKAPTRDITSYTTGFSVSAKLLNLQAALERKLLNIPKPDVNISDFIRDNYPKAFCIDVPDLKIKSHDDQGFEVILNLSDIFLSDDPIYKSRNGIWNILFSDLDQRKHGPIGFWEILDAQEGIGASLIKANKGNYDHCELLSACFFNRAWSMTETAKIVTEGAVSMVLKELGALFKRSQSKYPKTAYNLPTKEYPGFRNVLRYLRRFYFRLGAKTLEKLGDKFLGIRPEKWSLFLGTGEFETSSLEKIRPIPMPKDEFWADPFLFEHHGTDYVFFENYSYRTKKGKISCARIEGTTLVDIKDVLVTDYHLSFPFIFRDGKDIYLMPETSGNKRLELYRAVHFPVYWELYSTAFEGELVADPFFYTDEENQRWLFLNKQMDASAPMNSELHIYKVDSLKLETLVPHQNNPVLIDARVARNGGGVFTKGGISYRPSQRNVDGIYGRALNINQIKKLSLEEYEEEVKTVYYPTFAKHLMAIHHLHQTEKAFVFDAAYLNSLNLKT